MWDFFKWFMPSLAVLIGVFFVIGKAHADGAAKEMAMNTEVGEITLTEKLVNWLPETILPRLLK